MHPVMHAPPSPPLEETPDELAVPPLDEPLDEPLPELDSPLLLHPPIVVTATPPVVSVEAPSARPPSESTFKAHNRESFIALSPALKM